MSEQKPSIGRILIYTQPPGEPWISHQPTHPCIVTKVWSDDCVNVKVFADGAPPFDATSCLFSQGRVAWPPRV